MTLDKIMPGPRVRFVVMYLVWAGLLLLPFHLDEYYGNDTITKHYNAFIASLSAFFYNLFAPHPVETIGNVIRSGSAAVQIQTGCNGILMAVIFCAGVIAFPAPLRYRLHGIALGMIAIFAFNIVRINILFLALRWSPSLFDFLHVVAEQFVGIMFAVLLWIYWLNGVEKRTP